MYEDSYLDASYEDRYEPYGYDAEEFERTQLALDNDLDREYDDEDGDEYDPDADGDGLDY